MTGQTFQIVTLIVTIGAMAFAVAVGLWAYRLTAGARTAQLVWRRKLAELVEASDLSGPKNKTAPSHGHGVRTAEGGHSSVEAVRWSFCGFRRGWRPGHAFLGVLRRWMSSSSTTR